MDTDSANHRLRECLAVGGRFGIWPSFWPLTRSQGNDTKCNQHRNAPYITRQPGSSLTQCELCSTGWMGPHARISHFNTLGHVLKHSTLCDKKREMREYLVGTPQRLRAVDELKPYVASIHHASWRLKAMEALCMIVTERNGNFTHQFYDLVCCIQKYVRLEKHAYT